MIAPVLFFAFCIAVLFFGWCAGTFVGWASEKIFDRDRMK